MCHLRRYFRDRHKIFPYTRIRRSSDCIFDRGKGMLWSWH
jgi:hypothetical protein